MTKEEYKKNDSPTINHFYESIALKDKMNTAGKTNCTERHRYMEGFLAQFLCGMGRGKK
jgi:uncharacterized protein